MVVSRPSFYGWLSMGRSTYLDARGNRQTVTCDRCGRDRPGHNHLIALAPFYPLRHIAKDSSHPFVAVGA